MPNRARKQRSRKRRQQQQRVVRLGVAAAVLLALVGGSAAFLLRPGDGPASEYAGEVIAEAAYLGDPDAPVVIEEFADFQCSACRYLSTRIMPQLIHEFVNEGVVKLEYRHFTHYGDESVQAGMAAECANEQGAFRAYHDRLFAEQRTPNSGAFSRANLIDYALDLGLNATEFETCLSSNKYRAKLRADTQAVRNRGGTGTPTLFVNGRMLGGVPPMDQLRALIRAQLR